MVLELGYVGLVVDAPLKNVLSLRKAAHANLNVSSGIANSIGELGSGSGERDEDAYRI